MVSKEQNARSDATVLLSSFQIAIVNSAELRNFMV